MAIYTKLHQFFMSEITWTHHSCNALCWSACIYQHTYPMRYAMANCVI